MIPISSGCKWLVQFGGKIIILIFYRTMVSLVCAAHWSMKSLIPQFFAPIWWSNWTRNSAKADEVTHELEFAVCLVGRFLHFWSNGVCCNRQSPVEVISLCHHRCNLAEQWPGALILFHHGKNHLCTRAVKKVSDLNFFRLNKSSTGSVLHCGCGGDIYAHAWISYCLQIVSVAGSRSMIVYVL